MEVPMMIILKQARLPRISEWMPRIGTGMGLPWPPALPDDMATIVVSIVLNCCS